LRVSHITRIVTRTGEFRGEGFREVGGAGEESDTITFGCETTCESCAVTRTNTNNNTDGSGGVSG